MEFLSSTLLLVQELSRLPYFKIVLYSSGKLKAEFEEVKDKLHITWNTQIGIVLKEFSHENR